MELWSHGRAGSGCLQLNSCSPSCSVTLSLHLYPVFKLFLIFSDQKRLLLTRGSECAAVPKECLGRQSRRSISHSDIRHSCSQPSFGCISCFCAQSSLLCACSLRRKKTNIKTKFFPFSSVQHFNLLKLPSYLPKAALKPSTTYFCGFLL